jgi:hypothetical protein
MLKSAIIVCAICAGAGGTAFWLKAPAQSKEPPNGSYGMPSIVDMQAKSRDLPILEVKELF